MEQLKQHIQKQKPCMIISVGDIVSRDLIASGISLNVLIVDNKTMRKPIKPIEVDSDQTLFVSNPAGAITNEAWDAIKCAVAKKGVTKVMVDGEEDLLTVVTVLSAPDGAFVVYGQPHVGIVVVEVSAESRENMRRIVDLMQVSSKS
ncbi:MAG: GTP-dependent dephospho-CoA kinase family protein [Candidatus Bathyarchaeota archaeon]|nr:GTP-dependent dephospho-CoA kinase family protein [Candidatus Bathyarchaeota archaeon]